MTSRVGTVAVIDDDFRVLEALENLFASYGYLTKTYSSAEVFFASDVLSDIHCIIADVEMRRISGLELVQRLRSSGCEVPVIIITGKPSTKNETFYLDQGANGFFRKPVDGQALVTLIDHLLT